jgi:hypothetical protein
MPGKKKSTALTRTSGGQPGNLNAFKHGFYAKKYRPFEIADLTAYMNEGLQDEIALLRVIIRRVFEIANDHEIQDLDTWSRSLNTLGTASTRLAGLLKTQSIISGGNGNDIVSVLSQALGEVSHGLGWTDPRSNRKSAD